MFEVLVYLFENYFEANIRPDLSTLARELSAAGFEEEDINGAFDWFSALEEKSQQSPGSSGSAGSLRLYGEIESQKISSDSQSFLMFLEQAGVLTPAERELVIDRAMALPGSEVTLEETKWIALMALWKQGKARDYLFVEDALFSDARPTLH
jgi:Smg protein